MLKILVILDGAADLPMKIFKGKTPLEAAETPNLDFFAKNGRLGYMYPINENTVPGSDNSLISIFGNDPEKCKRGVYEAIGAGFNLKKGDLALRTNFVTIDNIKNRKVIDRRVGRNLTSKETNILCKEINKRIKLPCKFEFKNTVQHRGVLILRGNFSDNVTNVDNEWLKPGEKHEKFNFSLPMDESELSVYTAKIINDFVSQSFIVLNKAPVNFERIKKGFFPANMIFLRGAGNSIPKLKQYPTWMSINSMPLEIGIAKVSGMKNFSFKIPDMVSIDAYEHLYKLLNKEINFSIKIIKKYHKKFSGCYIHFKESDDPGHDNKPYDKKRMIEIIDKKIFSFLKQFSERYPLKLVVTCDHSTLCSIKSHSAEPVPVLVYGDGKDDATRFSESEAKNGSLGKIYGREFMEKTGLVDNLL